jgi:ATP-dependent DNA helicase RecG
VPLPIPAGESLTVEFKSDRRSLSDSDIVAAVVCLANTEGGDLYLGVEDSGQVTGVVPQHENADAMRSLVASRTQPRLTVVTTLLAVGGKSVMHFQVPRAAVATCRTDGLFQRRQIKSDGTPECVAMQTHEIHAHGFGSLQPDPSEAPIFGATEDDLDPLERERLRRMVEQSPRADKSLLDLDAEEIDASLGLVQATENGLTPTLLGLLLIGKSKSVARLLPTHEVAVQFFRETTPVVNEHKREPLLNIVEYLDQLYTMQPAEGEMAVGPHRFPVPSVDRDAFREAVINAFAHRDYTLRDTIVIRWDEEEVEISSPGGLVNGVTVHNLLTTAPSPRNQKLAEALKRLGLVERSARGVDRIFEGQARYGRRLPDYGLTTRDKVVVQLDRGPADLRFTRAVLEYERTAERRLAVREILILAGLRRSRKLTLTEIASAYLQTAEHKARTTVDALLAAHLVAAHGRTRAKFYTLGPVFLHLLEDSIPVATYVTPTEEEQENQVLAILRERGQIRRKDITSVIGLTEDQAKHRLRSMVEKGLIQMHGERKGAHYVLP